MVCVRASRIVWRSLRSSGVAVGGYFFSSWHVFPRRVSPSVCASLPRVAPPSVRPSVRRRGSYQPRKQRRWAGCCFSSVTWAPSSPPTPPPKKPRSGMLLTAVVPKVWSADTDTMRNTWTDKDATMSPLSSQHLWTVSLVTMANELAAS